MSDHIDAALVWFRRDLRCTDHAALYHALKHARRVWCAFVFDTDILDELPRQDRRASFIHSSVIELDQGLAKLGEQQPLAHLNSSAASGATTGGTATTPGGILSGRHWTITTSGRSDASFSQSIVR